MPDDPSKPIKPPSASTYRIAKRLKISGTLVSVMDWGLSQTEYLSEAFKHYRYDVAPYWTNAIYYLSTSAIPFFVNVKECFYRNKRELAPSTESAKHFLADVRKLPKIREALQDDDTKKHFVLLVEAFQYEGNNLKIDISLNSIFLILRAFHGFLFLLQGFEISSRETNEEITDISGRIYNAINYVYLLTLILQKLVRENNANEQPRKGLEKFKPFWKAYRRLTTLRRHNDAEESKSDSFPPPPTPSISIPTPSYDLSEPSSISSAASSVLSSFEDTPQSSAIHSPLRANHVFHSRSPVRRRSLPQVTIQMPSENNLAEPLLSPNRSQ